MNKKLSFNTYYKLLIILLAFLNLIYLTSCSPQRKPPAKESKQQEEEKEIPKELNDLKKSIEKIEKTLMTIHEDEEKEKEKQNVSSEDKNDKESSQQQGQSSQGNEQLQIQIKPEELSEYNKQQKKIEEQDKKLKKENELLEKFDTLKKDVTELHSLWNTVEPKLMSSLAPQNSINNFENALNLFTNTIQKPDAFTNLLSLIELYKYLPDFYELYKTKEPPDLDRLRFGVKKIKLVSEKDDYNNEKIALDYLFEKWSKAKPKFKKDSMSSINKFELALNDLKTSIESKNKTIIRVKSEVLIKIIDEIAEASKNE